MQVDRKSHEVALYKFLYVSKDDLVQASFYARHLLKKNLHFEFGEDRRRWPTYMEQSAYTTSLVVAYSRPFVKSRGRINLPEKMIRYSSNQMQLHNSILRLRNEIYAHSDVEVRKIRPVNINGYPSGIEFFPVMRLARIEIEEVIRMIHLINFEINARLKCLLNSISCEG